MIFCPGCSTANRDGSLFCNQCGMSLVAQAPAACPRCGATNPPGTAHCPYCGLDLTRAAAKAPAEPDTIAPSEATAPDDEKVPQAAGPLEPRAGRRGGLPPWLDAIEQDDEGTASRAPGSEQGPHYESRLPPAEWSADAIPIEPIVGVPYRARPWTLLPPTAEQQAAAQQFADAAVEEVSVVPSELPAQRQQPKLASGWRWLIAFTLFFALLVPRFLPNLALSGAGRIPPSAASAAMTVEALPPGSLALVAFEYDAGSAGEMQPIAEAYLHGLLGRGVRVLAVSTLPEGGALADMALDRVAPSYPAVRYGEEVLNLGYVPGGEAAVRALAGDIAQVAPADYRQGVPLGGFPIAEAALAARSLPLIVVLGQDLTTVQRWIEQVATPYNTPMLAGVPALAEATLAPYWASGQLRGLVAGIDGAAAYEHLDERQGSAGQMLASLRIGSWAVAGLLLLINLSSLIAHLRRPSRAGGGV